LLNHPPFQFKSFKLSVKYVPFPCGLTPSFFIFCGLFCIADVIFVLVKDKDDISVQKLTIIYVSATKHPIKIDTYPRYLISVMSYVGLPRPNNKEPNWPRGWLNYPSFCFVFFFFFFHLWTLLIFFLKSTSFDMALMWHVHIIAAAESANLYSIWNMCWLLKCTV
jgi:hypothetical protein